MNILIANAGNIRVNEIKCLAEALNKKHNVTIVSMAAENFDNMGQAFSFSNSPVRVSPLLYKEVVKNTNWVATKSIGELNVSKAKLSAFDNIAAYEFFSNPADAISIMLGEIMITKRPDMVICGINNGLHMGQDVYSSSNIGMAMEASFFRVPAIAVAVEHQVGGHGEEALAGAVKFIEKNVEAFSKLKFSGNTFLSINIPAVSKYSEFKGVKITQMGQFQKKKTYEEKTDIKGNKYFWLKNMPRESAEGGDDECAWFDKGFICVTPVNCDATDYTSVDEWNNGVIKKLKSGEVGQ